MEIQDFIDENRAELKECIGKYLGHVPKTASCTCPKSGTDHYHNSPDLSDEDLHDWILNDEGIYRWARRSGVDI